MPSEPSDSSAMQLRRRRRLGWWFVAGFILVFAGMALLCPMDFYNGRAIYRTKLWRYYVLEVQLASRSSGLASPTSDNAGHAVETLLMHVLISAIGGGVGMGLGWLVHKSIVKRTSRPKPG